MKTFTRSDKYIQRYKKPCKSCGKQHYRFEYANCKTAKWQHSKASKQI